LGIRQHKPRCGSYDQRVTDRVTNKCVDGHENTASCRRSASDAHKSERRVTWGGVGGGWRGKKGRGESEEQRQSKDGKQAFVPSARLEILPKPHEMTAHRQAPLSQALSLGAPRHSETPQNSKLAPRGLEITGTRGREGGGTAKK